MSVRIINLDNIFATFFDSNIKLLKLTSLWIYDDKRDSRRKYQHLYNILWSFYIYIFYEPAEILYLYYSSHDLSEFLRSLRDMGNHFALIYKSIIYFATRKELLKVLEVLSCNHFSYEEYGDFRPGDIVEREKGEAIRWTKYFWCFVNAICLTMFLSGLYVYFFNGDQQFIVDDNGKTVYGQVQPVKTISPFGYGTREQFLATFFYTIIALTYYAWMIVALDSLFITIMSCITAHLKIIEGAFRTLHERCAQRIFGDAALNLLNDPLKLENEVQKEMRKCVEHLQTIFKISEKLELIYCNQTFVQTFISLLEICFSLYLLSEVLDANTGNEICYLLATGFEILMYCWFGNRITEASGNIIFSLYDNDWYSTSISFKKQMIFTMTRMQRPIYITIGKFTPLTFTTFLTIVRGSYSFFTFLRQSQREGLGRN